MYPGSAFKSAIPWCCSYARDGSTSKQRAASISAWIGRDLRDRIRRIAGRMATHVYCNPLNPLVSFAKRREICQEGSIFLKEASIFLRSNIARLCREEIRPLFIGLLPRRRRAVTLGFGPLSSTYRSIPARFGSWLRLSIPTTKKYKYQLGEQQYISRVSHHRSQLGIQRRV